MPPLTTQQVEVRFGKVDGKTSDKLLTPGALTTAQNTEVTKTGRYQRRSGTLLLDTVADATRIHSGERELLVGTNSTLFSDLDGSFDSRGSIASYRSRHTPINNSTNAQEGHDFLRLDGLDWHVWSEAGGIFYAVRDSVTGAYLVVDGVVSTTTDPAGRCSPRIVQGGPTTVFIVYIQDGDVLDSTLGTSDILCRKIDTSDPTTVSSESTITANQRTGQWGTYDVTYKSGTTVCLAYLANPAANNQVLRLKEWNTATMTSSATLDSATLQATMVRGWVIGFFRGSQASGYTLGLAGQPSAGVSSTIRKATAAAGLSGAVTLTTIYTGSAVTGEQFNGVTGEVDSNGDTQILASMISSTASARQQLWRVQRTAGGVNSGPFIRYGFVLMGKLFTFDGQDVVPCSAGVTFATGQDDRTIYLIEIISGAIVGRAIPSLAAAAPTEDRASQGTRGILPEVLVVAATATEDEHVFLPTLFFQTTILSSAAFVRFDKPLPARWLEIASVTLVPGSTIFVYDGAGVSELGFYHPPQVSGAAVVGTVLADGDYYYRGTWAWVDAQGRLHDSEPSEAVKVTTSGGNKHPQITIQTLNATLKSSPVSQAVLRLWRTTRNPSAAGAAAFFLVVATDNDPTADTIVIDDAMNDATLAANERLYTLGNAVLANNTPPPANALATWNGRVWAIERDLAWYSKTVSDGFGIAFPDVNFVQASDDRGDLTAVADAGPRLALFKASTIYTISGDGPDDTGKGGFSPLRRLPVPLGARSAVAVVSTELGVFFQDDASGQIWLLPPDGDPIFAGKEVSDLAPDLTIVDMVVVPQKRQVRIFSEEGTTLVYDLLHQLWTWFSDQDAVAATVVDDVCGYVTTAGDIRFDDADTFEEGAVLGGDGVPYTQILETGWIAVNGIGGYQRTFAVTAAGERLGDHTIACTMSYRYSTGIEDTGEVVSTAIEDNDFGYRIEARPAIRNQKATAIKVRYEDDAPLTAGFGLEAMNLTVGIRPTRERLTRAATTT